MPSPPDFSSQKYWSTRFQNEQSFEWLVDSSEILPLILASLPPQLQSSSSDGDNAVKVLHLGCGSSSLGTELRAALREHLVLEYGLDAPEVKVTDTDYVVPPQYSNEDGKKEVEFRQCDILDLASLKDISDVEWDLIVDKSTADAISCGFSIPIAPPASDSQTDDVSKGEGGRREPIEVMCDNLAQVVRSGGRWICVSYSDTRFHHLSDQKPRENVRWKVVQKLSLRETTGQRVVKDGAGERVVYEPSTCVCAYVLERF